MYPSKLVPYILRKKQTDTLTIYKFSVFLTNGGKGLWDLSQGENPEQTLAENGFVVESLYETDEIVYAKIDEAKTNMNSFYTWTETKKEDCWRIFHLCVDLTSNKYWFHSQYIETIFDGSSLTPQSLFSSLLSLKT